MQTFNERLKLHAEHVHKVGGHCTTEETTKQALILPLLDILGFSPYDPTRVRAEHGADMPGVKASERVDYALFCNGQPVMFIEAKPHGSNLSNHAPQLARYFNSTPEVVVAAITNGREWRFFTDLDNRNVMDSEPFYTVDFHTLKDGDAAQLNRFHHDHIQPSALRELAEQSLFLSAFKKVLAEDLREPTTEFVRHVANRAHIQRQFTAKFIEGITPIVRHAVAQVIGEMVTSGLSAPTAPAAVVDEDVVVGTTRDPMADEVNGKIVTTRTEKQIFQICQDILGDAPIEANDTESYFAVLYAGKTNRWLIRYIGDKKVPTLSFGIDLSDAHRMEIARAKLDVSSGGSVVIGKPENLYRLTGLLHDALAYCINDQNFTRPRKSDTEAA
ncbi:type I restriction endonuclease [Chitinimonas viridis]|uniref:Type I restriction endonuclease n=1 Tax=Chitinimonas viridis TaxID=664880 RepID=A0ABT8B7P1_9NEIS|nr:type I restriction endonuclease [Chitinimonas viridis]MDN3578267.1 type I restriction endonuclease [Chitinimonas viridis]